MALQILTEENFQSFVGSGSLTLVSAWAAGCPSCKVFGPVFEEAAERHPEHTFGRLDAQAERKLIRELEINMVPALLVYREGLLLLRFPGHLGEVDLDEVVGMAAARDMGDVRAELAAWAGPARTALPRATAAILRGVWHERGFRESSPIGQHGG